MGKPYPFRHTRDTERSAAKMSSKLGRPGLLPTALRRDLSPGGGAAPRVSAVGSAAPEAHKRCKVPGRVGPGKPEGGHPLQRAGSCMPWEATGQKTLMPSSAYPPRRWRRAGLATGDLMFRSRVGGLSRTPLPLTEPAREEVFAPSQPHPWLAGPKRASELTLVPVEGGREPEL